MSPDKQNEIKKLYQEGYNTSDIYEHLKQEGISFIAVMNYIKSNKRFWAEETPIKDICYVCERAIDIQEPKQNNDRLYQHYVAYTNTCFYLEEMNICHECVVYYVKAQYSENFINWAKARHKLL